MAMTTNPYDRRDENRRRDRGASDIGYMPMTSGFRETHPGLELADLQAMAFSARARGEQAASDRLTAAHEEAMLNRSRAAWQEGYELGAGDGARDMLARIDNAVGERVREQHARLEVIIATLDEGAKGAPKVSEEDLRLAVLQARTLLGQLIDAHHNGFVELPF